MECYNLLEESDLCLQILELPDIVQDTYDDMLPYFKELIEDIQFPQYNQAEIKQIEREIQQEIDITTILDINRFNFPFYPELLKKLKKSDYFQTNYPQLFTNIVLYSYLSWCSFYIKCHDSEFLIILLNCLQIINASDNQTIMNDFKDLSISAFYNCYQIIYRYSTNICYDNLIFPLETFLTKTEFLPQKVYSLLGTLSLNIFDAKSLLCQNNQKQFLIFITNRIKYLGEYFPYDVIDLISQKIASLIYNLDLQALNYLKESSKYMSEEIITLFMYPLIQSLIKEINDENTKIKLPETIDNTTKDIITSDYTSDSFYKPVFTNFDNNFNFVTEKMMKFEIPKEEELFSAEFLEKIKLISDSFSFDNFISQKFIDTIVEILFENNKICSSQQYLLYLFICNRIIQKHNISLSTFTVYNGYIFNPSVTVFNQTDYFREFNILRYFSVDLILKSCQKHLMEILLSIHIYPYLFSEVILRISTLNIKLSDEDVDSFAQGIFNPYLSYRNYNNDNNFSTNCARKSVLILLANICRDKQLLKQLFSSKVFLERFYSLFYEEQTQENSTAILSNFLQKNSQLNDDFIQETSKFIDSLFVFHEKFNNLEVILQILTTINKNIAISVVLSESFSSLTECICNNIVNLPNSSKSLQVLMEVVTFLAFTSSGHSIDISEIESVENTIKKLTNGNPTNEIKDNLIQIIAGRHLSYILPNFEISQPKVLSLFVKVFLNSDKLLEILNFLIDLCNESVENCYQCNYGSFDIFLIELVDHWRLNGLQNLQIVTKTLDLILTILSTYTDPIVVKRFISLLSLLDEKYLPFFHEQIITAFNRLLLKTSRIPAVSLNLDDKSEVTINGFTSQDFGENITLSFWLYYTLQEKVTKQVLFFISDNSYHSLKICLRNTLLNVKIYNDDISYNRDFDCNFKNKNWHQVSVVVQKVSDTELGCKVTVFVNGKLVNVISKFTLLKLNGNLSFKVNSISNKYKNNLTVGSKLSSFDIYNFPFTEDDSLLSFDFCHFSHSGNIFHFEPTQIKGNFGYKIVSDKTVNVNCQIKTVNPDPTFSTVFVDYGNIINIIPIFSHLDLEDKNHSKSNLFEENLVDILKNCLSLSDFCQQNFLEISGFKIIAHLLLSTNPKHLTYQLYVRFFSLLQILTIENLTDELYSQILLNIQIWIRSDKQSHIRILKHWSRTIYNQSNINLPPKTYSFCDFLRILRIFYFFDINEIKNLKNPKENHLDNERTSKNDESQLIVEENKNNEEILVENQKENEETIKKEENTNELIESEVTSKSDTSDILNISDENIFENTTFNEDKIYVKDCRRYIYEIMTTFIFNLTESETMEFFTEILSLKDKEQKESLLSYLFNILSQENSSKIKNFIQNNVSFLVTLIDPSNDCQTVTVYNILAIVYKDSRRKELSDLIFKILNCFDGKFAKKGVLEHLKVLIKQGFTEFAPIAFWTALILGENELKPLIESFDLENELYFDEFSLIYPFLSCFVCLDVDLVCNFLVAKFTKKWKEIFYLINLFGRGLNLIQKSDEIQNVFLSLVLEFLMKNCLPISLHIAAFQLCYIFIFFRQIPQEGTCYFSNVALDFLFSNSVFCENKIQLNFLSKIKTIEKPSKLTSLIDSGEDKFSFGLRFDKTGKWADRNLSSTIIFMMTSNMEKILNSPINIIKSDSLLLLCGYLYNDDPSTVKNFLDKNRKFVSKESLSFLYSKIQNLTNEKEFDAKMSDCQRFMENMTDLPVKKFDDEKNYGEYMIEFITSMFKNCLVLHTNLYNEKLFCFIEKMKEEKENNEKLWKEMWEKLRNDNTSPYYINLP